MAQNFVIAIIIFVFSGAFSLAFGQAAVIKPVTISGDVASIAADKIVISATTGATGTVEVALNDKTEFKRVPAENPSMKTAVASTLAEISVGDRVIVTGVLNADGKSLPARKVYLMSKSDIVQKKAKDAEKWRTRGITGRVTLINTQMRQVTIETPGALGAMVTTVLTAKPDAKFIRYAPDSVKFDEAKPSSLAEIAKGDDLRAVGDKGADGAGFTAEEVLTGSFQTVAGNVKSVDVEKNEIVVTDVSSKKDVTISLNGTSVMKKFPVELAQRMAGMQGGAGGARPISPGGSPTAGGGATSAASPAGPRPGGFGGGQRAGGIDDMLARFPDIKAADLVVGEMIAVSSTKGGNPDKIKAIKLLAGVEPFVRMAQMGAAAGGGRGQGSQVGMGIPGLDGFSMP